MGANLCALRIIHANLAGLGSTSSSSISFWLTLDRQFHDLANAFGYLDSIGKT